MCLWVLYVCVHYVCIVCDGSFTCNFALCVACTMNFDVHILYRARALYIAYILCVLHIVGILACHVDSNFFACIQLYDLSGDYKQQTCVCVSNVPGL